MHGIFGFLSEKVIKALYFKKKVCYTKSAQRFIRQWVLSATSPVVFVSIDTDRPPSFFSLISFKNRKKKTKNWKKESLKCTGWHFTGDWRDKIGVPEDCCVLRTQTNLTYSNGVIQVGSSKIETEKTQSLSFWTLFKAIVSVFLSKNVYSNGNAEFFTVEL